MKMLRLSIKRCMRPRTALILAVLLLLPLLCSEVGSGTRMPEAGYVCEAEDSSDISRLCSYLDSMGFQSFTDENELRSSIASGEIDCGLIIPQSATGSIATLQLKEFLVWIDSPSSDFSVLRRAQAASAAFAVAAPHYVGKVISAEGLPQEAASEKYYDLMDSGKTFSFDVRKESGLLSAADEHSSRYLKGFLSILLFICMYFEAANPSALEMKKLKLRLGTKTSLKYVFLPDMAVRTAIILTAAEAGCALFGSCDLLIPLALYCAALIPAAAFLAFLPGNSWKTTLIALLCLAALVVCPIFIDLSLLFPGLSFTRFLVPPAWLWMLA